MHIISFLDRPGVIKKILKHLGLWEEAHAQPDIDSARREIIVDLSYGQLMLKPSPSLWAGASVQPS
jgi:hypothetical protein